MSPAADVQKRPDKAAGTSLIFLGNFNPAIFQPAWLMRHGLIPDDNESVEIEVITPQVTAWGQAWLRLVVAPDRCEFHATDELASVTALHDLVAGVFSLLPHVPLTAFGLNLFAHIQMESEEAWHDLGFSLFRTEPWEGVLDDPRMRTVQVLSRRGDDEDGAMTATVQPSAQFKAAVFVSTNDDYNVNSDATDADEAVTRLGEVFEGSIAHSRKIIERVRGL